MKAPIVRVVSNPSGRIVFLCFTLIALILLALTGIACSQVSEGVRWVPAVAAILGGLAYILLTAIAFSGLLYCMRMLNVAILLIMAVGCVIVDVLLLNMVHGSAPLFALSAVSSLAVYLGAMGLILIPDARSDMAHRMHPYVAEEPDLGSFAAHGRSEPSSTHDPTMSKRGKKHIKHREVCIFEDWPAPEPFSALALYSYRTTAESELSFSRGTQLVILDCRGNWWQALDPETQAVGFVPSNYIQVLRKGTVLRSFTASVTDEVDVREREEVEVMEVHELMSLVRNVHGKIGSVPTDHLQINPVPAMTSSPSPKISTHQC